jgi:hypothetical protein
VRIVAVEPRRPRHPQRVSREQLRRSVEPRRDRRQAAPEKPADAARADRRETAASPRWRGARPPVH